MNNFSWYITEDNTNHPISLIGYCCGMKEYATHPFRIIDEKGKILYKGMVDYKGSFEPLDRLNLINLKCNYIQYKTNGRWSVC
jgi:hypothetical protein